MGVGSLAATRMMFGVCKTFTLSVYTCVCVSFLFALHGPEDSFLCYGVVVTEMNTGHPVWQTPGRK